MLKSCPQCGQQLNPPIQSISRQVCYHCGWSGEVVVETQKIKQSFKQNQAINQLNFLKPLLFSKKSFWSLLIIIPLLLIGSVIYLRQVNRLSPEFFQLLEEVQKLQIELKAGINQENYKRRRLSIMFLDKKIQQMYGNHFSDRELLFYVSLMAALNDYERTWIIKINCNYKWSLYQDICVIDGELEAMQVILKQKPEFDSLKDTKLERTNYPGEDIFYFWNGDILMQNLWHSAESQLEEAETIANSKFRMNRLK